jgi:putative CocE/NonD family hydrolase
VRVVESFPWRVREIEHLWIPLSDGCRLAARLWLPEGAEPRPVPAILEYIPYGKREGTRARDEPLHRYFAGHGYAAIRVDLRGSGESEGLLSDEYLEREQLDGVEVIGWIASQPWCTGDVGMIGKSWGGFNALQIAARRPPALRALICVCATDDRYADDVHYMGGCLLNDNLGWATAFAALVAQPPDPALVGEAWRAMWRARLEAVEPPAGRWLRHPLRDAYWRQGSVCEDYAAITCPVFAVSGWSDGYSNAVPRLLAGLRVPRKGLVGPWGHQYPHQGVPGPAIGFLQEALRWWDRWLRGHLTGVEAEPVYRAWLPDSAPPRSGHPLGEGRWVAEDGWPSPRIAPRRWELRAGGLDTGPRGALPLHVSSPPAAGMAGGAWCGFGAPHHDPADQREDDARSLCFDSEPLEEPLEILGAAVVELEVASDQPETQLAVRLVDVSPEGWSARVSYGLLDLTHLDGHARRQPLEPGRPRRARVVLNDAAHHFAAGHRVRLALSTGYWPLAWPAPARATLSVLPGRGGLELPVRPPRAQDTRLAPFGPAEGARGPKISDLREAAPEHTAGRAADGSVVHRVRFGLDGEGEPALWRLDAIDLVVGSGGRWELQLAEGEPRSASASVEHVGVFERGDWRVRVEVRSQLRREPDGFRLEMELRALEGGREFFRRRWVESIPAAAVGSPA